MIVLRNKAGDPVKYYKCDNEGRLFQCDSEGNEFGPEQDRISYGDVDSIPLSNNISDNKDTIEKSKKKRKALKITGLAAAGIGLGLLGRHYLKNRNVSKNTKFTAEDLEDISGNIKAFSSPNIKYRPLY